MSIFSERKESKSSLQKFLKSPKFRVSDGSEMLKLFQPPIDHLLFQHPEEDAKPFNNLALLKFTLTPIYRQTNEEDNKDKEKKGLEAEGEIDEVRFKIF